LLGFSILQVVKQTSKTPYAINQWSSTSGTRIIGVREKNLTLIKTKHRKRFNLEPALIVAPKKIRTRVDVLACQKQASH
jgi:hypothetical protein